MIGKIITGVSRYFNKFQNALLILSSIFLFTSVCTTVFMRYVLKISLMGMEEIILLVVMWAYFLGAANCSHEESHITAEVLDIIIKKETVRKWIALFGKTLMVGIAIAFAYYGWNFLQESLRFVTRTPYYRIPYYAGHASICYGTIVMCIYTISHYVQFVKNFFHKDTSVTVQEGDEAK